MSLRHGLPLVKELRSQSKNEDPYGPILKQYRFYRDPKINDKHVVLLK